MENDESRVEHLVCFARLGRDWRVLSRLLRVRPRAVPGAPCGSSGGEPNNQSDRARSLRADRRYTPVLQCPLVAAPVACAGVVRGDPVPGQIVVEQLVHVLEDKHVGIEHADALIAQTTGRITV